MAWAMHDTTEKFCVKTFQVHRPKDPQCGGKKILNKLSPDSGKKIQICKDRFRYINRKFSFLNAVGSHDWKVSLTNTLLESFSLKQVDIFASLSSPNCQPKP